MNFDFLKEFEKRMKKVGTYTLISYNSFNKAMLKNYGFEPIHEGTNVIYSILLYIMEQSLKEEACTIDDIASFLEAVDRSYFHKHLTFTECKSIADFVVNTVLCNNGEAMYFKGYSFEASSYKDISISLVNNKTVEVDSIRRTSYYLTDEGYYLVLGTLEIESNLKLTIQEMIFKLHLEKADYDKAIDDVKQLFNLSRIQLQRTAESIRRIRENVLSFMPEEYDNILNDNIGIIEKQKKSFKGYRDYVSEREQDLVSDDIDIRNLNEEEEKALKSLGIIKRHLSRVIDEHQRILNSHFDFKKAYSDALAGMTAFSAIKRINMVQDLYEPILQDIRKLDSMPRIFRPIYLKKLDKYYNIRKCVQSQRVIKGRDEEEEVSVSLDETSLKEDRQRELRLKLEKYKGILEVLLSYLINSRDKSVSLESILNDIEGDESKRYSLIPSIEMFREIMIELLKTGRISTSELMKETKEDIDDNNLIGFELNSMLLQIIEGNRSYKRIKELETQKDSEGKELKIYGVRAADGYVKTVRCSNLIFRITV